MPLTCPRCHAQNQDGMAFCQQCGAPLSGEAAAPPLPPAPPPADGPTIYQAPPPAPPSNISPAPPAGPAIYQPVQPPQPPRHRLPGASIVGVLVGVLGVVTAVGILFGHRGPIVVPIVPTNTPAATAAPTQVALPTQPQATAQPPATETTAPLPTDAAATDTAAPEPTNAAPATDTAAPLPTEAPATETAVPSLPTQAPPPNPQPLGPTLTTQYFSVQAPSDWNVQQQNNEVLMSDPHASPDEIDIAGGTSNSGPTDVQTVLNGLLQAMQQKSPDAAQCGQSQQATFGGKQGTLVPICFTFTPQSGAAVSAVALAWAAVGSDGSTIYVLEAMATKSQIQTLLSDATPVFHTLQWIGA